MNLTMDMEAVGTTSEVLQNFSFLLEHLKKKMKETDIGKNLKVKSGLGTKHNTRITVEEQGLPKLKSNVHLHPIISHQ